MKIKSLSSIIGLVIGLLLLSSCSCSPEAYGRKDAIEWKKATLKGNINHVEKAERKAYRHQKKYDKDLDKLDRYFQAYKDALR